jgi:hypothetical protein
MVLQTARREAANASQNEVCEAIDPTCWCAQLVSLLYLAQRREADDLLLAAAVLDRPGTDPLASGGARSPVLQLARLIAPKQGR